MMKEFNIDMGKLFMLSSPQFYDFLDFCECRKHENKFYEDLYNFLDQYSIDFAAYYIGDDI